MVDEAMIAFKVCASFRQYIRGKPHPFGIKAFVLTDSKTLSAAPVFWWTN